MPAPRSFDPRKYWTRTLRRLLGLLSLWLLAGPIASIVLIEPLNTFSLGGIPFGFWMAQQGSIFVFVVVIFLNAWFADRLDKEFGVEETPESVQHLPQHEH